MQDELKIEDIDVSVGINITDITRVDIVKYFGDDYLDVLDVDPMVTVRIAATEFMLRDLDKRQGHNGKNGKVCSEPPQVYKPPSLLYYYKCAEMSSK
jgi:hypothetical protein